MADEVFGRRRTGGQGDANARSDLALQVVARRLVNCMQGEHTVGRLGGDEFCVVVEVQSARDAEVLAAALHLLGFAADQHRNGPLDDGGWRSSCST